MPKIKYTNVRFSSTSLEIIEQANKIISEYADQGFDLTLRQLYYQFVSRDLIANKQSEYKRLGSIINDARLAGLIDWEHITDRTRNLRGLSHWNDPRDIIWSSAQCFQIDKWLSQRNRVEVWIEKDALVGVIEDVCNKYDVNYFSCRGYTSQSEMWAAAQRIQKYLDEGQEIIILHFGDHDPSGIDMTRDIEERLNLFIGGGFKVKRLALNMEQIEKYNPPPNPAKSTDSRYSRYLKEHGNESWELDALEPKLLSQLIEQSIDSYIDWEKWDADLAQEEEMIDNLKKVAINWHEVENFIKSA